MSELRNLSQERQSSGWWSPRPRLEAYADRIVSVEDVHYQ